MELPPISSYLPSTGPPGRVDDTEPAVSAPAPAPVVLDLASRLPPADRIDVQTARNKATGLTITEIVSHDSGEVIIQIPLERILDRVAFLIEQQQPTTEQ